MECRLLVRTHGTSGANICFPKRGPSTRSFLWHLALACFIKKPTTGSEFHCECRGRSLQVITLVVKLALRVRGTLAPCHRHSASNHNGGERCFKRKYHTIAPMFTVSTFRVLSFNYRSLLSKRVWPLQLHSRTDRVARSERGTRPVFPAFRE